MSQRIELEGMTDDQIGRLGHSILGEVLQSPEIGAADGARDHVEGGYSKSFTPAPDEEPNT